jgi:hypothetical protein
MGNKLEMKVDPDVRQPGRTFELWVLLLLLFGSALSGFLRLQAALYSYQVIVQLGMQPGPAYAAITGAGWGIVSLVAGGGLLLRQRWAPDFTRIGVVTLALAFWIDRLAFNRSPDTQNNLPFLAGVTIFMLVYTFAVLSLDRQKRFFES